MLDETFFKELNSKPLMDGISFICSRFLEFEKKNRTEDNTFDLKQHENYLSFLGLLQAYVEASNHSLKFPTPGSDHSNNMSNILQFFHETKVWSDEQLNRSLLENIKSRYLLRLDRSFSYEFTQGDLDNIQRMISELRDLITKSKLIDEDHRRRLLKRLEKLQSELNKKMSSLDQFWGLVGEAGVILGKFGNDAKPFFDRIEQIVRIVWRTQAVAEELPMDTPPALLAPEESKPSKK